MSIQDINQWLEHNQLNKFKQYFQENEVSFDDFLECTEQDLDDMINDIPSISSSVYIKRFKDSVKNLQQTLAPSLPPPSSSSSSNKSRSKSINKKKPHHIRLTSKEKRAKKLLKHKLAKIDKTIKKVNDITQKVYKNKCDIKLEINSGVNSFITFTQNLEKKLYKTLDALTDNRLQCLSNEMNENMKVKEKIQSAQKQYNKWQSDGNMEVTGSQSECEFENTKAEIKEAIKSAVNQTHFPTQTLPPIQLQINNQACERIFSETTGDDAAMKLVQDQAIISMSNITDQSGEVHITHDGLTETQDRRIKCVDIKYMNVDVDDDYHHREEGQEGQETEYNQTEYNQTEYKQTGNNKTETNNTRNWKRSDRLYIDELMANQNYTICGRYKLFGSNGWSAWSEPLSFKTTPEKREKWDISELSGYHELIDMKQNINGRFVVNNAKYSKLGYSVFGTRTVNHGVHEWKLKLHSVGKKHSNFSRDIIAQDIFFGIATSTKYKNEPFYNIDHDFKTNYHSYAFGTFDGEYADCICDCNNFKTPYSFWNGDTIEMTLDLYYNTLTYKLNEGSKGIIQIDDIYNDSKIKYRLAMYDKSTDGHHGNKTKCEIMSYRQVVM